MMKIGRHRRNAVVGLERGCDGVDLNHWDGNPDATMLSGRKIPGIFHQALTRSTRGRRGCSVPVLFLETWASTDSTNDVAIPIRAIIHIQKIAPGPPIIRASATPPIFPMPTRVPIPTANAWNEVTPWSAFVREPEMDVNISFAFLIWGNPRYTVSPMPTPMSKKTSTQEYSMSTDHISAFSSACRPTRLPSCS